MEVNLDILISDRCPQHVQSHNINLIFRKLLIYWKNIHRKSNHVADQHSTLPIIIFSDETSGNTTTKWNRLETYSFSLASLPRKEIHQFINIKFLSVSNLVDSVSLGKEIASDLSSNLKTSSNKSKISLSVLWHNTLLKKDFIL